MPKELQQLPTGDHRAGSTPLLAGAHMANVSLSCDAGRAPELFLLAMTTMAALSPGFHVKTMRKISKFISLVLRHAPETAGVTLDKAGWVSVDDLLAGLARAEHCLTRDALFEIVAHSDKQRFTLSPDKSRIRAAQGHSIPVDLGLTPLTPPEVLFHGTATRNLGAIRDQGLLRRNRLFVHLSTDTDTARKVGKRYGSPHILRIDTVAMIRAGHVFYRAENGVWLTDHVPPHYLNDDMAKRPPDEGRL